MGSLFGGWLAEGGSDVCLIDINQTHLDAVNRNGLRLTTDQGERRIRLNVARPGDDLGSPDVVLIFTKTMHTKAALSSSQQLTRGGVTLVSMQNGLGNMEILREFAPLERVVIGMTTYPADLHGPGDVVSHGSGKVRFMSADGTMHPILQRLEAALVAGGVDAAVDPRVIVSIWEKVAFNAALNSLCAITGRTVGEIGSSSDGRALVRKIIHEVAAVAHASGVDVDIAAIHRSTDHALDHHLHHKPSMLQDVLAGRATEIESINGAVVAEAERLGIKTPTTESLLRLVRILERAPSLKA